MINITNTIFNEGGFNFTFTVETIEVGQPRQPEVVDVEPVEVLTTGIEFDGISGEAVVVSRRRGTLQPRTRFMIMEDYIEDIKDNEDGHTIHTLRDDNK
jgi:hypothetical protein